MRLTTHINRRVTQSIMRAFDYAKEIDRPLNTYVVIHLRESERQAATTAFKIIRHKFRDWLAYKAKQQRVAIPPDYIYAFENPDDDDVPHVNWALHVPDRLRAEFEAKLARWVEKVQGRLDPFDIHVQPITPSHAKRLAKYICKGTDAAFVSYFYLDDVHAPQGEIWGKRAGVSPSIGTAIRKEAGFRPRRGRAVQFYTRHQSEGALSAV